jgi:hypothetical protein
VLLLPSQNIRLVDCVVNIFKFALTIILVLFPSANAVLTYFVVTAPIR